MKKMFLSAVLLIATACTKKHDGLLTLEIKNGAGVLKEVNFEISESTIEEIEKLNINKTEKIDQVIRYSLAYANGYLDVYLNNPSSYDFIDDSIGNIYVLGDTIKITYNFTAQNGFGNKIISKAYIDVYNKNGQKETDIKIE